MIEPNNKTNNINPINPKPHTEIHRLPLEENTLLIIRNQDKEILAQSFPVLSKPGHLLLFSAVIQEDTAFTPNDIKKTLKTGEFLAIVLTEEEIFHHLQTLQQLCNKYYYHLKALLVYSTPQEKQNTLKTAKTLHRQGLHHIHILSEDELKNTLIPLIPSPAKNTAPLPYLIIGDIHGCYDELINLLQQAGYDISGEIPTPPKNYTTVFLGDLTDRGNGSIKVMNLVINMVKQKKALFIAGNHDIKLVKYLEGKNISQEHGIETTIQELKELRDKDQNSFNILRENFINLVQSAPPYLLLDEGRLAVTHGGIKEKMIGKDHKTIRNICLYGETTGKFDEKGLPERRDWAKDYNGKTFIVYGHTPRTDIPYDFRQPDTPSPNITPINNTLNIDGGCCFGGFLMGFSYPDKKVIITPAKKIYYKR